MIKLLGFVALLFFFSLSNAEPMLVTPIGKASADDKRAEREVELLRLSLNKTRAKYGDFEFSTNAPRLTQARSLASMKSNRYVNFIRSFGYNDAWVNDPDLAIVKFPIFLGVLSYRVCFISSDIEREVSAAAAQGFDSLKQFTHGQGVGWVDTNILQYNGLRVREVGKYENLFRMTALNRIDMFCRGASELLPEYQAYGNIDKLTYDKSFTFYYPLILTFYSNSQNQTLISRVEEGLKIAYGDGSLQAWWEENFAENVGFVDLHKRRTYRLENPLIKNIDFDFEKYVYKPQIQ